METARYSGMEEKLGKGSKESRKEKERNMSFGNIEMWKRKKEELMELEIKVEKVEGGIFERSKKTPRSPKRI